MSTAAPARRMMLLGVLALFPLAPGCTYSESGAFYSNDSHTYVSTTWRPWTVTLVDTRTGEAVWSADVPVGQQLNVRFRHGGGPSAMLPDMMDWGLMDEGTWYGHRDNRLPVPGRDARLLRATLRAVPELPGAVLTSAPVEPDEILETVPDGAAPDEMMMQMEQPSEDEPEPTDEPMDEAPIDLPD
ncbi:MAG: hypothetical protein H6813_05105 [Phycisphaeraceae bacterium]|nr:hypothetical protein [Phycisphaeraceae bacterium]MCB9847762.1 hypothetical protein [Phycisphaeraceae bacterium]